MAAAQYNSAQFNLGYSVISAPRDGKVLRKLAEERELVAAGTPVLVFGESDRGYVVRAALADREIVNVKLGDKGEIRMDAFPGQPMTGTIVEIASAADERTGMFPIEVQFDSPPPRLVSGLVARLRLAPTTEAPPLTYVPMAALVEGDGDRASVFVVDGGNARSAATCASRSSPPTASRSRAASPRAKPWSPTARCSSRTAKRWRSCATPPSRR